MQWTKTTLKKKKKTYQNTTVYLTEYDRTQFIVYKMYMPMYTADNQSLKRLETSTLQRLNSKNLKLLRPESLKAKPDVPLRPKEKWEFPKSGVPYFGVLIIGLLLFRVLYEGPLFPETPKS